MQDFIQYFCRAGFLWKLLTGLASTAASFWCCVSPSTQFLPHTGDRILITGAADTKVHVHDLTVKETIHMFSDHTNRVKRIATAPMWPNTFWSAAEDGMIRWGSPWRWSPGGFQWLAHACPSPPPVRHRQYDLRENSKHSEVLVDLTEFCGQLVEAKCLAVNPRDNNYLAVGANGPFVRLYDIRMIHNYRLVATFSLQVQ